MLAKLDCFLGLSTSTKTYSKMDPIGSIAKGVAGATLDKLQEIIERDQTSEDAETNAKLKKALLAKLSGIDIDGLRDEQGDLRSKRGTNEAGGTA